MSTPRRTHDKSAFLNWGVWIALVVTVIGAAGALYSYLSISRGITLNSAVIVYLSQALLQISVGVLVVGGIGLFAVFVARALAKPDPAAPDAQPVTAVTAQTAPAAAPVQTAPAAPAAVEESAPAAEEAPAAVPPQQAAPESSAPKTDEPNA